MNHVLFRLNVGTKLGLGHFFRCKHLASEFIKKGFKCIFLIDKKHNFFEKFKNINFKILYHKKKFSSELEDLKLVDKYIGKNTKFFVLDDYRLKNKWIKSFKKKNKYIKLVIFNDSHLKKYKSDFTINASKHLVVQSDKIYGNKLYGSNFSIINPKLKKKVSKNNFFTILIYFGGGYDYGKNFSDIIKLLKFFIKVKNIKINFVVGPFSKNINKIKKKVSSRKINFHEKTFDLTNIISSTDFYLGSASSIIYELNYLKVPSIIFTLNKKQKEVGDQFFEKLGNFFILDVKDLKYESLLYLIDIILKNLKTIHEGIKERKIDVKKDGTKNIFTALIKKRPEFKFHKEEPDKLEKNTNSFQYAKINDINEFLDIRNQKKNRDASLSKNKIKKIEHYIWWFDKKVEKFKLISKNQIKLTLWRKKILIKNKHFYTGGWSTSKTANINEIFAGYKNLLKTKKFKWIGVAKKENRFLTWLNLKMGFNILKENDPSTQIKQFIRMYKIKKTKSLNFFIN